MKVVSSTSMRTSCVEAFEIAHLALAEDDDASRTKIFVKPGQREAGLLDVGAADSALEPAAPAQQLERETHRAGTPLDQARNRQHGLRHREARPGLRLDQTEVPIGSAKQHRDGIGG